MGLNEIDLLNFMRSKRDEVEKIVQLTTQSNAQKLPFSANIELIKPSGDECGNSHSDRIKFFVNSKMQRVDFTGFSKPCFSGMVEKNASRIEQLCFVWMRVESRWN